jgi:hypothetical protein
LREFGADAETFDRCTFVACGEGGAIECVVPGEDDECEGCGFYGTSQRLPNGIASASWKS